MVLWVIKQTRTGNDSKAERAKRMVQETELQKHRLEHCNSMPKSYNAGEKKILHEKESALSRMYTIEREG